MRLSWDGGPDVEAGSRAELVRALVSLDPAKLEFVVLEDGRHRFAQAGAVGRGFLFELRDAVAGTHRQSARTDLTWGEVQGCLSDYLERTPGREGRLEWRPAPLDGKRARALGRGGKAGLRRSGWIMLAFGLVALGSGALQQRQTADFLANAREAAGEVVAVQPRGPSRSIGLQRTDYDVRVRFTIALAIPGALTVLIGAGMVLWARRGPRR